MVAGVNSFAFLTFNTLVRTASGVTSPTTVTFLAANSILNDVTPEIIQEFIRQVKNYTYDRVVKFVRLVFDDMYLNTNHAKIKSHLKICRR